MTIHKKPSFVPRPHSGYIYEIAEFDKNAKYLIGWPGYRTSRNKSGLGYVETQAELAHMYGLFIVWLLTGKFRTHNPVYLFAMTIMGLYCGGIPIFLAFSEIITSQSWYTLGVLLINFPYVAGGLLLLVNAFLSIVDRKSKTITGD